MKRADDENIYLVEIVRDVIQWQIDKGETETNLKSMKLLIDAVLVAMNKGEKE